MTTAGTTLTRSQLEAGGMAEGMFLKINDRVHNLAQVQHIDLGTVADPRVVLRFPGQDAIILGPEPSRKVRNFLTNGEARVIECSDLPDPTPAPPVQAAPATPAATTALVAEPEPTKEPATAAAT